MKTKKILTSIAAIAFAIPAMADMTETSTFPVYPNLMQANTKYLGAATSTNMDGVYEDSVNAIAEYENINYDLTAGKYLPQSSVTITDCPSGSYCTGIGNVNYSTSGDQGKTACPSGYGNSAIGSSADTQCYRACSGNVTIAHATGVTGNDYYGAGVDTCEPTGCENGWTLKPGAPDLTTIIGVTQAGTGYTSNDYTGSDYDTDGMSNTIISNDPMAFAVDYGNGKGVIKGHGRCSKTGVTTPWYNTQGYQFASDHFVNNLTDETDPATGGQYCYCQLDSYTPVNGSAQSLSAPWVFNSDDGDADRCAVNCAGFCAHGLRDADAFNLAFRAAVFGSLGASLATCDANVISITWSDASQADIDANEAGTATYGGDIKTPRAATDKTNIGLRFKGWRFSKPQGGNQ